MSLANATSSTTRDGNTGPPPRSSSSIRSASSRFFSGGTPSLSWMWSLRPICTSAPGKTRPISVRQWHKYSDEEIKLENYQARLLNHARRRPSALGECLRKVQGHVAVAERDKHVRKALAFADASNSIAAVTAAAAAGYAPFSQAGSAVASSSIAAGSVPF